MIIDIIIMRISSMSIEDNSSAPQNLQWCRFEEEVLAVTISNYNMLVALRRVVKIFVLMAEKYVLSSIKYSLFEFVKLLSVVAISSPDCQSCSFY